MKRVKIWRKRNEKHEVKNKEDKKGKQCGQGELLLTRNINKKENKFQGEQGICFEKTKRMRQAKRDTSWKEIETEGKWQKHETNRFYGKKKK